jgi:tRNA dimethylallyltransferase
LAEQLADQHRAVIVSADSRQIYRGFNIGTAKPSLHTRARVIYYGIDIAEPVERFSAARWAAEAREWICSSEEVGRRPLVVGGTGLYVKALVEPFFRAPELDATRRVKLEGELGALPLSELRRWCGQLDPARAHLGRTQVIRAIEIALLAGRRISELHASYSDNGAETPALEPAYLLVDPGPAVAAKIETRVDRMIASGWPEEVEDLATRIPPDAPAWKASGYRVMRDYVKGKIDLSSARERVIIETRQYAKRQRTWFRHQLPSATVTRVNPDDSGAGAVVREWWERTE